MHSRRTNARTPARGGYYSALRVHLRAFRVYAASIARFRSARPSKLHSPSIDAPLPPPPPCVSATLLSAGRRARYFREREESEKKHVDACFLVRECSRRRNVGASTWRLEEFVCARVRMCVFFFQRTAVTQFFLLVPARVRADEMTLPMKYVSCWLWLPVSPLRISVRLMRTR